MNQICPKLCKKHFEHQTYTYEELCSVFFLLTFPFAPYQLDSFQVVIVGNGAVGKSSMIQKYCKGIFTAEYKKTIGVDFLEKRIW